MVSSFASSFKSCAQNVYLSILLHYNNASLYIIIIETLLTLLAVVPAEWARSKLIRHLMIVECVESVAITFLCNNCQSTGCCSASVRC